MMNKPQQEIRMGLIYLITNQVNSKRYVGQSILSLAKRWSLHKSAARRNSDFAICRAIRKHREENFTMKVLEVAPPERLDELEKHYIRVYNSHVDHGQGYNCTEGGRDGIVNFSKETRAKMSAIQKTLWESIERRNAWGISMKQIHHDNPEIVARQRQIRLRFLADHPEVMIKHSADMVQYHADNPQRAIDQAAMMTDYWQDEAFRKRMVDSHLDRYATDPEIADRHSDFMAQLWHVPEYRKAMMQERTQRYTDPSKRHTLSIASHVSRHVSNPTGYRGITKHGSGWSARIKIMKKTIHLGTYRTQEAAARAYDAAARHHFGPAAFQNFPEE